MSVCFPSETTTIKLPMHCYTIGLGAPPVAIPLPAPVTNKPKFKNMYVIQALRAHCVLAVVGPTFDLYKEGNSAVVDYTIKSKSQREHLLVEGD